MLDPLLMNKITSKDIRFILLYGGAFWFFVGTLGTPPHIVAFIKWVPWSTLLMFCYLAVWFGCFQLISKYGQEAGAWLWHLGVLLAPIVIAPFVYRRFEWQRRYRAKLV